MPKLYIMWEYWNNLATGWCFPILCKFLDATFADNGRGTWKGFLKDNVVQNNPINLDHLNLLIENAFKHITQHNNNIIRFFTCYFKTNRKLIFTPPFRHHMDNTFLFITAFFVVSNYSLYKRKHSIVIPANWLSDSINSFYCDGVALRKKHLTVFLSIWWRKCSMLLKTLGCTCFYSSRNIFERASITKIDMCSLGVSLKVHFSSSARHS